MNGPDATVLRDPADTRDTTARHQPLGDLSDIPDDTERAAHRDTILRTPARHSGPEERRRCPLGHRPGTGDWIPESLDPRGRTLTPWGEDEDPEDAEEPLPPDLLGARPYGVRELLELFDITAAQMALITRRSERSVRRWAAGRCLPKGRARFRLEQLQRIAWCLEWSIGPDAIKLWIHAPNEGIHGHVPLELMMADRTIAVAEFVTSCRTTAAHQDYWKRRSGEPAIPPLDDRAEPQARHGPRPNAVPNRP
jgi:hypothetical protein